MKTTLRVTVAAAVLGAAVGCGSKKNAASDQAAPAPVMTVPAPASFDELVAKTTAARGAPTLVVPGQEASWATVHDAEGSCTQLRISVEEGHASVVEHTSERATEHLEYGACADAAAGSARGRRFAEAWAIDESAASEQEAIARYTPLLGAPSLRVADAGKVRLVWAAGDRARCFFLKASFEHGIYVTGADAIDAGLPWFDECSAWADGRPTAVRATTVGTPAAGSRATR
jgi:hypothetical protein